MKFKSFVMPRRVQCEKESLSSTFGRFIVEPLERGYGTTLGNSLRRIMLSSIQGASIKAVKIEGVLQEVSSIPGVYEDVTDIILNLKGLVFKLHKHQPATLRLSAEGPGVVTGEHIDENPDVDILNKEHHIATLEEGVNLEMELYIDIGRGYVPAEYHSSNDFPLNTIVLDCDYNPVRRVKYSVENTRVKEITDYDKLILEITTDGSVHPEDVLAYAGKILKDHLMMFINFEDKEELQTVIEEREESREVNQNLFKGVDELELSVRAYNCLKAANIKTIAQLVGITDQEMLKYRNFGKKSLMEIKDLLTKMGLSLGQNIDNDVVEESLKIAADKEKENFMEEVEQQ